MYSYNANRIAKYLIFTLTGLFVFYQCGYADETVRLKKIQQHIISIQNDLKKATIKKTQLQKALKNTEIAEGHLTSALNQTHIALIHQRKLLQHLDHQASTLTDQITTHKDALQKQIRAAFLLSRQPFIKYLLDADSIQQYQHIFVYFQYLTTAQAILIKKLQKTLIAYDENKQKRQKALHTLMKTQQHQLQNKQTLVQTQKTRYQLIKTINHHITTKQQKLSQLIQDKQELENTIRALNQKKLQNTLFKHAFSTLRGQLSWPLSGKIIHPFGTQIGQSELRWSGILIKAPTGASVRAVATGKVIFAKWLQGYGLLLILDHGNGYMTLYGRNQSLLKKVGDWVNADTIIATAGQSGGFENSGLYFSIRHNAKPLNPEEWLKKGK